MVILRRGVLPFKNTWCTSALFGPFSLRHFKVQFLEAPFWVSNRFFDISRCIHTISYTESYISNIQIYLFTLLDRCPHYREATIPTRETNQIVKAETPQHVIGTSFRFTLQILLGKISPLNCHDGSDPACTSRPTSSHTCSKVDIKNTIYETAPQGFSGGGVYRVKILRADFVDGKMAPIWDIQLIFSRPLGGHSRKGRMTLQRRKNKYKSCLKPWPPLFEALTPSVWSPDPQCLKPWPPVFEALTPIVWSPDPHCLKPWPPLFEALTPTVWSPDPHCLKPWPPLFEALTPSVWSPDPQCLKPWPPLFEALTPSVWSPDPQCLKPWPPLFEALTPTVWSPDPHCLKPWPPVFEALTPSVWSPDPHCLKPWPPLFEALTPTVWSPDPQCLKPWPPVFEALTPIVWSPDPQCLKPWPPVFEALTPSVWSPDPHCLKPWPPVFEALTPSVWSPDPQCLKPWPPVFEALTPIWFQSHFSQQVPLEHLK